MGIFIIHQNLWKPSSRTESLNTWRCQRSTVVDIPTPGAGSVPACQSNSRSHLLQMLFLRAETQKAFTIFLAGAAFTLMVLPKASLVPAFLAGFILVLIMQRPGIVNFPAFFTSAVARVAKVSRSCEHCDFFKPLWLVNASAMPPFERALAETALAFITFMATPM